MSVFTLEGFFSLYSFIGVLVGGSVMFYDWYRGRVKDIFSSFVLGVIWPITLLAIIYVESDEIGFKVIRGRKK